MGLQLQTTAILAIIFNLVFGSFAIDLGGPRLLSSDIVKHEEIVDEEKIKEKINQDLIRQGSGKLKLD